MVWRQLIILTLRSTCPVPANCFIFSIFVRARSGELFVRLHTGETTMPNPFRGPRLSYHDQDCLIFEFTGMIHIFVHDPEECTRRYGNNLTLGNMTDNLIELFLGRHLLTFTRKCRSMLKHRFGCLKRNSHFDRKFWIFFK